MIDYFSLVKMNGMMFFFSIFILNNVFKSGDFSPLSPYRNYDLILQPYDEEDFNLIETLSESIENVVEFAGILFEQTVLAIKNIKLPKAQLYTDLPQAGFNTSELISIQLRYPVEEHTVQTSDGYILGLERISPRTGNAPVVLIFHGFLASSQMYVINSHPYQNLPTILSDEGYDVWLGNFRGSPYSRRHVKYTEDEPEFWEFSINEMALIDIPEVVDYVLKITGRKSLSLCGHSMGTAASFGFLSKNLDYAYKINIFLALAPVAKTTHMTYLLTNLSPASNVITILSSLMGTQGKLLPGMEKFDSLISGVCKLNILNSFVCQTAYSILYSIRSKNVNETLYPLILAQFPSSTSTYVLVHFSQLVQSDRFQMFNFGFKNEIIYHQEQPPSFPVWEIKTPVALYSSDIDVFADQRDIEFLRQNLPNKVEDYIVDKMEEFGHYDFCLGQNAHKLIYPAVLRKLNEYGRSQ